MARPTKLNPETAQKAVEAIRVGNHHRVAARLAGISPSTFYAWLKVGKRVKCGPYKEFLDAEKRAEAEAVVERIARIRRAAEGGQVIERRTITRKDGTVEVVERLSQGQWTADGWWLERTHPEDYSNQAREIREIQRRLKEIETKAERQRL